MEIWLNFKAWEEDPNKFVSRSEVKDMPCYPNDGSIQVIDGVLVVKFQETEEEMPDNPDLNSHGQGS